MKISKQQLQRIIKEASQLKRESAIKRSLQSIPEELAEAGLTPDEVAWVESEWKADEAEGLYDNQIIFDKIFNYYMDIGEMPYEVAKARTATPDEWIYERWIEMEEVGMGF